MRLFYYLGEKLYGMVERRGKRNFMKKQTAYDMKNLYPGKNTGEMLREYYIEKIANGLCVLALGLLFAVLIFIKGFIDGSVVDEQYITRRNYGEGSVQAEVIAGFADGSTQQLTVNVQERKFKEEELEIFYEEAKEQLLSQLFVQGDSPDGVRNKINFLTSLPEFPFQIQWESEDYELVDYDGAVYNENLSEMGQVVNLTALFAYGEFKREYCFPVHILPPVLSKEQQRQRALEKSVAQSESVSAYEEKYTLPECVDGEPVTWEEKRDNSWLLVLLLSGAAAVMVYSAKDRELHKQVAEKQEEMLVCYPELVNRLVLYIGAGMTVRNAWRKIALEHKEEKEQGKRKGYIYREMLFSCYEMDSGVAEGEAYERFGRRCGIQQYIKLSTLLVQNMQKGNSALLKQLTEEAENAFVMRMNQARKKGEEAGTKLLAPMMLMLGMVMIFIMVPAFGAFGA